MSKLSNGSVIDMSCGSDARHAQAIVPFAVNEILTSYPAPDPRLATTKVYKRSDRVSERVRKDLDNCLLFAGMVS